MQPCTFNSVLETNMQIPAQPAQRGAITRLPHIVHFYSNEGELLNNVLEFILDGWRHNNTCIIIARTEHITSLKERLLNQPHLLRASSRLQLLDAASMREHLGDEASLSWPEFFQSVGLTIKLAAEKHRPVRVYGEMASMLWQDNMKDHALELESYWNKLATLYAFSLYCSYPKLHFVMDDHAIGDIMKLHTHTLN